MKRSLVYFLMVFYLSVGCGITSQVGGPSRDLSLDEAALQLIDKEVMIVLVDGTEQTGTVTTLTSDALVYRPAGSDSTVAVRYSLINRVRGPQSTIAIAGGAIGGVLVGGLAGCFLVAAAAEADETTWDDVKVGMLIGGVAAGLAGGLAGSTQRDVYEFPDAGAHPDSAAHKSP